MTTTTFAAVSGVKQRSATTFDADLSAAWTIGGRPNGGYLLATIARAAGMVAGQPDVLAASAHYLRPPSPGPASVVIEPVRSGRTVSQLRGRLEQDGLPQVEALLTFGVLGGGEPFWRDGVPDPQLDAPRGARVETASPSGLTVALMDEIDLRLDRPILEVPTGRGELRGWLALPSDEPFDPVSLLFAIDALPPATADVAKSGWVPTLELTAYVRARPEPGPVRVLHRAHLIGDGRVDESCHVWDRTGRLVAQGTQLAGIRLD
ncbi:thioesterase family protein [Amycolatopsis jiangsuensis]|uniref:Acyl-coenzyme A thioesterase PaaI-like protein n=1 Tax=Amycolatopsis jiangsuensis TaxID=1181879 RepID=A0A840IRU3_9PSEU|nr:thioesterase family protein [Amycolatopsis jiangsuensis]MBB4684259.1 acyl-coenzyme A thioesterase PaaI-like protein [Amycolatopsis jiangsuensis]